jgi:hypothetical protein
MFGSKQKAIGLSLARFDKDTQTALLSLYNKIDGSGTATETKEEVAPQDNLADVPF